MKDQLSIDPFRALIQSETCVNDVALSDELLKCFLQARKNNLKRAFDLFKNYQKMALYYPNLMAPPPLENFQFVCSYGHYSVSPIRDKISGCSVIFLNLNGCDEIDLSAEDSFACQLRAFQYIVSKAETRHVQCVIDVTDFTLKQLTKGGPLFGTKLAALYKSAFPIRIHGIHILNEHPIFKLFKNIISPFLSSKIRNRIHFHGDSLKSLHQHVSPNCLPSEYGGSLGPIDQMNLSKIIQENKIENIFDCLNEQLFPCNDSIDL